MSDFSIRLIEARKTVIRLSQAELAEKYQVSRSAYSAWESGRNEPPLSMIKALCQDYDISADYLLGLTDTIHSAELPAAIAPVVIPRDPLSGLSPDRRKAAEDFIAFQLAQQEQEERTEEKSQA